MAEDESSLAFFAFSNPGYCGTFGLGFVSQPEFSDENGKKKFSLPRDEKRPVWWHGACVHKEYALCGLMPKKRIGKTTHFPFPIYKGSKSDNRLDDGSDFLTYAGIDNDNILIGQAPPSEHVELRLLMIDNTDLEQKDRFGRAFSDALQLSGVPLGNVNSAMYTAFESIGLDREDYGAIVPIESKYLFNLYIRKGHLRYSELIEFCDDLNQTNKQIEKLGLSPVDLRESIMGLKIKTRQNCSCLTEHL